MSTYQAPLQADIMQCHPCFNEQAHQSVGRVHLPVAPRCNIQCNFCERRVCANLTMQHPGWAHKLLSVEESVRLVERLVHERSGESFVVGIAGPGEPLANPETFETLSLVNQEYPALLKCVSTNGLLLEEKLPQLIDVGVRALTVTINALDSETGQLIYAWVRHQDVVYQGQEAAELLIANQLRGLRVAINSGVVVKVNTVLIPGVNDVHMARLAQRLRELGVQLMNIMPLIPGGKMKDYRSPTCGELRNIRADCEETIAQFRLCEHCSADVMRFPSRKGLQTRRA